MNINQIIRQLIILEIDYIFHYSERIDFLLVARTFSMGNHAHNKVLDLVVPIKERQINRVLRLHE